MGQVVIANSDGLVTILVTQLVTKLAIQLVTRLVTQLVTPLGTPLATKEGVWQNKSACKHCSHTGSTSDYSTSD